MQIERTLLVGCDDSESALRACREAAKLAGKNDRIVLLNVVPPLPRFARDEKFKSMNEDKLRESRQLLEQTLVQPQLNDHGVKVEQLSREGDPASVIAQQAEGIGADIVVVGAGDMSNNAGNELGNVANSLLHETNVPVLVVR